MARLCFERSLAISYPSIRKTESPILTSAREPVPESRNSAKFCADAARSVSAMTFRAIASTAPNVASYLPA